MIGDNPSPGGLRPGELEQINRYTRRELGEDEVYAFSVALCDNDIDRDFDRFDDGALDRLARLFVGKTGLFDHSMKSRDQTARIHSTSVETVVGRTNALGQPYRRLVARAYIPRLEGTGELIAEIDAGVKREVSVSCAVGETRCSVCGADLRGGGCGEPSSRMCAHRKGRAYPEEGSKAPCHAVLSAPTDAYEWSFVAVPAQPGAGVLKSFGTHGKGGMEMDPEQLRKALETGGETAFTPEEKAALKNHIENLERDAEIGKAYLTALRAEAAALCKRALPALGSAAAEKMLGALNAGELEALRDAARPARAPGRPQLAPAAARDEQSAGNQGYRI